MCVFYNACLNKVVTLMRDFLNMASEQRLGKTTGMCFLFFISDHKDLIHTGSASKQSRVLLVLIHMGVLSSCLHEHS